MRHVSLVCHPDTPCSHVSGIDVRVSRRTDNGLILTYTLSGDIDSLSIPAGTTPKHTDELWRHTCFEAFVKTHLDLSYREFNFSPSGEWAAYGFRHYRESIPLPPIPPPVIECRACEIALELEANLAAASLVSLTGLRLALSAVIEDKAGNLSYWALRHPDGKPDFHHTDGFALELDLV